MWRMQVSYQENGFGLWAAKQKGTSGLGRMDNLTAHKDERVEELIGERRWDFSSISRLTRRISIPSTRPSRRSRVEDRGHLAKNPSLHP